MIEQDVKVIYPEKACLPLEGFSKFYLKSSKFKHLNLDERINLAGSDLINSLESYRPCISEKNQAEAWDYLGNVFFKCVFLAYLSNHYVSSNLPNKEYFKKNRDEINRKYFDFWRECIDSFMSGQ